MSPSGSSLLYGGLALVERSRLGRAMRTLAADHEVARLMGVDVNLVITLTFAIAAVLVGVAGILAISLIPRYYLATGTRRRPLFIQRAEAWELAPGGRES